MKHALNFSTIPFGIYSGQGIIVNVIFSAEIVCHILTLLEKMLHDKLIPQLALNLQLDFSSILSFCRHN